MQIAKGAKECYIHKGGFDKYCPILKKRRIKSNSKLEVSMLLHSKFLLSQRTLKKILNMSYINSLNKQENMI